MRRTSVVRGSSGAEAIAKLELFLDAVATGKPQTMIARGSSMWPALRNGDVVEISSSSTPALGSVVAVRTGGGGFFLHRVCGVRRDGALLVKGDHNPGPDGWFPREHVVGVVSGVRRGGRLVPVPSAGTASSWVMRWDARVRGRMRGLHEWCRMVSERRAPERGAAVR